jgi:hypothetical protein
MRLDRIVAVLALIVAVAALALSLQAFKRDPWGTDLSNYDLTSPERTLRSLNRMVLNQDLRAGWQLLRSRMQEEPEGKLFLADNIDITVPTSIEVSKSAGEKNNGLVVSFVTYRVSGVDYRKVMYFRKNEAGQFTPADAFYVPYGTEKNDQDKLLEAAIEDFTKTGKL